MHVGSNSGHQAPNLTVLESVRCLECGAVYAKPSGGGTVRENPGCPDCGYVGWVGARGRVFSEAWQPHHFDAGRLPHPNG
jgi:hypothetical protein